MNEKFLDPSAWPGGPQLCIYANLPAFESMESSAAFKERNAPATRILKLWLCPACGGWHYTATTPAPSGQSSGTARRASTG